MTAELLHRAVPLLDKPNPQNIVSTCDYLISQTLRFDHALLHATAEEAPPERNIPWYVSDLARLRTAPPDAVVYISDSAGAMPFRALLARFGASYMPEGCLYGGSARGTLFHDQKTFGYEITMSNDGRIGFWIRLLTWRLDTRQRDS